jgi:glucoamylase
MVKLKAIVVTLAFGLFTGAIANAVAIEPSNVVLGGGLNANQWLHRELTIAVPKIFRNISPHDGRPGAVIAAQTRNNPNYYYHWVRDAALTMDALLDRYTFNQNSGNGKSQEQHIIRQKLFEYFEFTEFIQNTRTLEGLGEPKYHVDGSAFNEPWGRPQNDGPALRAISLIRFAKILIDEGQFEFVRSRFYNGKMPTSTVIKRDLEFVSHQWQQASFDLWEEVKGEHFYTRMVQRRAMIEGADFASVMGDSGAANWYGTQARAIENDLRTFWEQKRGHFITTKNRSGGLDYKHSQLDTAFVLALLHGSRNDGFINFRDHGVQATMDKLANAFDREYAINQNSGAPAVAIGRYPEDRYGGSHFNAGNPWILTTLAFAEAYYRTSAEYLALGDFNRANEFTRLGDAYVQRVQFHAHQDGSLNEQIDRNSGYMTSVEDLTWNYGSVLTTALARFKAAQ